MSLIQVNPQFRVYVPHLDDFGVVWFVENPCAEEHIFFTLCMEKTGQIWTFDNTKIRGCKNPTMDRTL